MKRLSKKEIKKRIYKQILLDMTQITFINWIDIVYGEGMPIRKEALSEYKLEKLKDYIIIVQNQLINKVK